MAKLNFQYSVSHDPSEIILLFNIFEETKTFSVSIVHQLN